MTFEELFARAPETMLQSLVGRPGVKLLSQLDPGLTQPSKLREVALQLRSPQDLLLDKEIRKELFLLLPPHEAALLAGEICPGAAADPYEALVNLRIRRGSAAQTALLDFFSLPEIELDDEAIDPPSVETVAPTYGLFEHQRRAAEKTVELLTSEPKRALLHMPTGSGKTRTAMHVISRLMNAREPMLVIWLAHSQELCEQAVEEFNRSWSALGNREVSVHRWWGSHELEQERITDGLLVAGLAKAYSASQQATSNVGPLAGRVGLVVMDEAHQAIAPTYEHILELLTQAGEPTALLGLTATPGRTWDDIDEDERLVDFFYSRKVDIQVEGYDNPIDYLVESGYVARPMFKPLFSHSGIDLTKRDRERLQQDLEIPQSLLERLAEDEQRNLLIVDRVEELAKEHHRTLVFASTVEHALLLASVLQARGIGAEAVTGETPQQQRRAAIQRFRNPSEDARVLVNFGVLTTGFDAPETSAAVIARPTKSLVLYSQMIGRATRGILAGGNAEAEIVTVIDTELPGFGSMSEAFENWEKEWQKQ